MFFFSVIIMCCTLSDGERNNNIPKQGVRLCAYIPELSTTVCISRALFCFRVHVLLTAYPGIFLLFDACHPTIFLRSACEWSMLKLVMLCVHAYIRRRIARKTTKSICMLCAFNDVDRTSTVCVVVSCCVCSFAVSSQCLHDGRAYLYQSYPWLYPSEGTGV